MSFLQKTDYYSQIKQDQLETITSNNDSFRERIELSAQAEMESYLRTRFDVTQIFNKTGNDRNPLILMYMIDIALFHIHSRGSGRVVTEIREVRYNNAIEWLVAVSKGSISPDLPAYAPEEASKKTAGPRWGSWTKNINQF